MSMHLGGALIEKEPLRPGEEVASSRNANLIEGNSSVGGRLYLTNQRLVFSPTVLSTFLGRGDIVSIPLSLITSVSTIERGKRGTLFSGVLRTRLMITAKRKHPLVFVMNNAEDVAAQVRTVLEGLGGGQGLAQSRSPSSNRYVDK